MNKLEQILSICEHQMNIKSIVNIYKYGSIVYGTSTEYSDEDYIVIVNEKPSFEDIKKSNIDLHFFTIDDFQRRIDEHEISALECYFLNDCNIILNNHKFDFKLDKNKLRNSVSAKSSNSWVKCKKKLTVEKDYAPLVGKKSLFHSFRIVYFAIQIIENHKIINYAEANHIFNEIMNMEDDWDKINENFKLKYNNLMTTFRKLAPKET